MMSQTLGITQEGLKEYLRQNHLQLGRVAHVYNLIIREATAGGLLQVWSQSGLHDEVQVSHSYTARPCG